MSESKFLSPLKALKRPDDIASLYLLCIGLCFALAYSVSPMSLGKAVGIFVILLAATSGGYLITNYTGDGRDESGWLHRMTSATFMISIVLAAFVDATWLPFAWLLPIEFTLGWRRRVYGKQKKNASISRTIWYYCLIALGIYATYSAVIGHGTLWLPAAAFGIFCGCFAAMLLNQWHDSWSIDRANRRTRREREREWERDQSVVEALLTIAPLNLPQWQIVELCKEHERREPVKEALLNAMMQCTAARNVSLADARTMLDRSDKAVASLRRRLEEVEQELNQDLVGRVKLGKLVFEILARLRGATAPVEEGTLATWRRDIGFELVASHLLDLHPDTLMDYLEDWPVSGAFIKALLRHSQVPVTGYPSLPDEWHRVLTAILLANTLTQDAAPSAPAPAPQN